MREMPKMAQVFTWNLFIDVNIKSYKVRKCNCKLTQLDAETRCVC